MTAFCFLLAFRLAAPSSYRVDRGRHPGCRPRWGGSQCRALSPDFPAGARGLYPLARGCWIRPAPGMAPALMVYWIEGGAGFFLFSVSPGGAVELPGRSRPAPGVSTSVGWLSMSSSLSRFSGWRSRSLSLGEGLLDSTGARDGTRADGVLDRGRRRQAITGNKAIADQPPLLKPFYKESRFQRTSTRQHWIMQRLNYYAVKKTVEFRLLTDFQHVVDPTRVRTVADKNSAVKRVNVRERLSLLSFLCRFYWAQNRRAYKPG